MSARDEFKFTADDMPARRERAAQQINEMFAQLALANAHRDPEHAWKREVATAVLSGTAAPTEFAEEAVLRGLPPEELARDIIAKPNNVAARGLRRQRMLLAVAAAKTADELNQIVLGIQKF